MAVGNYSTCNMFTGKGLDMGFGGSFGFAWLGGVIIFFVMALARKWLFEETLQMPFSFIVSEVAGILSYIIAMSLLCSPKFALLIGLAAGLAGGYFGGLMFDDSGGGY